MNKSVKTNVILNVLRILLSVLFPLITFPYASRVLKVDNLGMVNYTLSIVNYFALFAALGISSYAIREGAKYRDNAEELRKFVEQVFTINIISTVLSYSALFFLLLVSSSLKQYRLLILIQSLTILFTTIGVDWINTIFEDYVYIIIRSFLVQLTFVVLLFILVKSKNDYIQYASLSVVSGAIISVSNLFHCKKYVSIKLTKNINLKRHLTPIMIFFVNVLTISIYVNSDTTMLGRLTSNYYVGIYTAATKPYNMIKGLLAGMYLVTVSRLSYYVSHDDTDSFYNLIEKIIYGLMLLLFPAIVAVFCLSEDVVLVLSGSDFIEASVTLKLLSIGLFFAVVGGFFTNCINAPNNRERINLFASAISAIVNIGANFVLIPFMRQNGAAITTVIAECIIFIICLHKSKDILLRHKYHMIKYYMRDSLFGTLIVIICCLFARTISSNPLIHIMIAAGISLPVYTVYLIMIKNMLAVQIWNSFKSKVGMILK